MMRRVNYCFPMAAVVARRCIPMKTFEFGASPMAGRVGIRGYSSTGAPPTLTTAAAGSAYPVQALKATITAAEEQVRHRQADVAAVTSYLAFPGKDMPSMPADADDTTRVLWKKKKWTEQDLDRAKQDLDRAELRLRDAKQDLDRAKQDLDRAEQGIPINLQETLDQFVTSCSQIKLSKPKSQMVRRCGGESVQEKIMFHFQLHASPAVLQHSCALALRLTGGVGKTFLSFCYPAGATREQYEQSNWSHVCVYAGFNSECPFTSKENSFLTTNKTSNDVASNAVGLVVMARVVGQLAALIAAGCPDRQDDLHHFAPNLSADAFLACHSSQFDNMIAMLVDSAVQQLRAIREIHKGRGSVKTTVLISVDEAQLLDAQLKRSDDDEERGARYALRILRQLQLAVTAADASIALLGIATGINPEISLKNPTLGTNFSIGEELISREECVQLALGYKSRVKQPPSQRVMAAHRLYPRVRDVLRCIDGLAYGDVSSAISTANAVLLLEHHIKKKSLEYRFIPESYVSWAVSTRRAIPYIDVVLWPDVLDAIGLDASLVPYDTTDKLQIFTCYDFERSAFKVLWFTMNVYFNDLKELREVGKLFRGEQHHFTKALGLSTRTTLNMIGSEFQLDSNETPHPFATKKLRELSKEFVEKIKDAKLENDGDALLLYLGKDSAADYMLLRRAGGTIKVWYGDAKTHVGKSTDHISQVRSDAMKFRENLEKMSLHKALCTLLPKVDPTWVVDPTYHCSIITHVAMDEKEAAQLSVLCPTTFVCEPWTSILYGEANARTEAEEKTPRTTYKLSSF